MGRRSNAIAGFLTGAVGALVLTLFATVLYTGQGLSDPPSSGVVYYEF